MVPVSLPVRVRTIRSGFAHLRILIASKAAPPPAAITTSPVRAAISAVWLPPLSAGIAAPTAEEPGDVDEAVASGEGMTATADELLELVAGAAVEGAVAEELMLDDEDECVGADVGLVLDAGLVVGAGAGVGVGRAVGAGVGGAVGGGVLPMTVTVPVM